MMYEYELNLLRALVNCGLINEIIMTETIRLIGGNEYESDNLSYDKRTQENKQYRNRIEDTKKVC